MTTIGEHEVVRRLGRIILSGRDAVSFTQSQVSNDVTVSPRTLRGTLILDPNGRINVAASYLVPTDEEVWLLTEASKLESLSDRLRRFAIRVKMTSTVDEVWVGSPLVNGADDIENRSPFVVGERIWIAPATTTPPIPPTSESDYRKLRISKRKTDHDLEGFDDLVPAALGGMLDSLVSFTKGCYTGQELVARMDARGANAPSSVRWFVTSTWEHELDEEAAEPFSIQVAETGQVAGEVHGVVMIDGRIEGFALIGRRYVDERLVLACGATYAREIVELSPL